MSHAIAAYPETRELLADTVQAMTLDHEALSRPLRRCDLAKCGGNCCHDGVYLSSGEAGAIRALVQDHPEELEKTGASLPGQVVVYGKWRDITSGPKTATRSAPMKASVADYPSHFPETNCVFLLPDARCALQAYSVAQGLHPWHWKPLTCWLHPLSITAGPNHKPILTLYSEETDPQRFDDYDGFVCRTHCGRTEEAGEPAWQVLWEEIEALGEIGDRDLLAELEKSF
ncbi:MAG: hypothetical protein P1U58_12450 [Verrucomicrobiales bacterium]|nr:hypothetical protein [Verrucomicrobiales bacterium]